MPIQYGRGTDDDADRFWEELAYKTWGWRLQVNETNELRAVIAAAIHRGQGEDRLQVIILIN